MWVEVGQLHQVLAVLKRLAQLLHAGLGPVHSVDPLQGNHGDKNSEQEIVPQQ